MLPERSKSHLFLEWASTQVFGLLPSVRPINAAISQFYHWHFNKRLANLETPQHFNDFLMREKLDPQSGSALRTQLTDKELVKNFVTERLGPGHVVPTLEVIRSQRQLRDAVFPTPCVVKPTHSSQEVLFLKDSQPTPRERQALRYWLGKSYFAANRELNYKNLAKKLIVEPWIDNGGQPLEDVKLLCFHGRPKLIQVDRDRFDGHRRDYFDIRGALLPLTMRKAAAGLPFPHPDLLPRMVEVAKALSSGFPFLRVDLYVVGDQLLVGELTSFPTNCTIPFRPDAADRRIASLFVDPDQDITPASFAAA